MADFVRDKWQKDFDKFKNSLKENHKVIPQELLDYEQENIDNFVNFYSGWFRNAPIPPDSGPTSFPGNYNDVLKKINFFDIINVKNEREEDTISLTYALKNVFFYKNENIYDDQINIEKIKDFPREILSRIMVFHGEMRSKDKIKIIVKKTQDTFLFNYYNIFHFIRTIHLNNLYYYIHSPYFYFPKINKSKITFTKRFNFFPYENQKKQKNPPIKKRLHPRTSIRLFSKRNIKDFYKDCKRDCNLFKSKTDIKVYELKDKNINLYLPVNVTPSILIPKGSIFLATGKGLDGKWNVHYL